MCFLVEITTTASETAKAIWEKASVEEATMALFQGMASAIANPSVLTAMYMIIDHTGSSKRYEYWERGGV